MGSELPLLLANCLVARARSLPVGDGDEAPDPTGEAARNRTLALLALNNEEAGLLVTGSPQ